MTAEQYSAWLADLEKERTACLREIRRLLHNDFLRADSFFDERASRSIALGTYQAEKIGFVQRWCSTAFPPKDGAAPLTPDAEQAAAISTVTTHVQVVARAGSGKTETLANRAVFLQKHCGVAPGEMLLLAFNRKAARELAERVAAKLGTDAVPHVMTFHALAYALVHPDSDLLADSSDGLDQSLSREVQHVLDDHLQHEQFQERVRTLMLAHFREDWERVVSGGYNLSPDEMLRYRRNLARETLRGDYVKSFGEKAIANFLFEHGIAYSYQRNHWWGGLNYRPDFTLPRAHGQSKGIVIEYFGLAGDPDYDDEAEKKREYWAERQSEWSFIELRPHDLEGGPARLAQRLESLLKAEGVSCSRLSDEEIWKLARERAIDRFTGAIKTFIGRCRKRWLMPDDLCNLAAGHQALSMVEEQFLDLSGELYTAYLDRLSETGQEDFDGLMQGAVSSIKSGGTTFARRSGSGDLQRMRYIFVDEYQDFSELFHRLTEAIRQANPDALFYCVGDDWQAINGFAGSDLKFYEHFKEFFDPSERLYLPTNYRSARAVVDAGNALMAGRGTPAVPHSQGVGAVTLVDLHDFQPTAIEEERFRSAALTPVVLRLAGKALREGKGVVLLNRRNELFAPGGGTHSLDSYLNRLRRLLPEGWRERIGISTAHGFKGKEADVIIILDAFERSYPLIHPDWVFARVLGESLESIEAENRRLFYVAVTRAKEDLFIITERGRQSPFLDEIQERFALQAMNWDDFPPPPNETKRLILKVSGPYETMKEIKDSLKAEHFRYRKLLEQEGSGSWQRSFDCDQFSLEALSQSAWMVEARAKSLSGVILEVHDDLDRLTVTHELVNGELVSGRRAATARS